METISRETVETMMKNNPDMKLVEVLSHEDYTDWHLPGAVNIPVGEDFEQRFSHLIPDKETPVVLYCRDEDCTASPSAARKLDRLGYDHIYDYEAGKEDWRQAGLPIENGSAN